MAVIEVMQVINLSLCKDSKQNNLSMWFSSNQLILNNFLNLVIEDASFRHLLFNEIQSTVQLITTR